MNFASPNGESEDGVVGELYEPHETQGRLPLTDADSTKTGGG